jgi:hypothetical protein
MYFYLFDSDKSNVMTNESAGSFIARLRIMFLDNFGFDAMIGIIGKNTYFDPIFCGLVK